MKKFLIKISYTVLPVWLFFVGLAIYVWAINDNSGDLMRLGLIDSGPEYTDSIAALALPEIYYNEIDSCEQLKRDTCDVLVVGDSFSRGGGIGKYGNYVNYVTHDGAKRVTVFTPDKAASPVQVAYDALNLGLIDSTHITNLIVQEGERYLLDRHTHFVTTNSYIPIVPDVPAQGGGPQQAASPLLRVKDFLFYHLMGANPIYTVELDRDMFASSDPRKLYFYFEDVEMGFDITDEQQRQIVACFDSLMAKAEKRGVNIVFVIACDKYDIYQDFIVDNPYPRKTLVDDVERWMAPHQDHFVFAKRVLHPLLEQGVKDVFLYNDTHWSPASSRVVAAEVLKKLK